MFTIFDTFESYPMDENDRKILKEMLEIAMKDSVFQWLKELPLDRISFRFCPAITDSNSVMGAFTLLHPLSVFLRDDPERITTLRGRSFWIELLFPTIVHELRHLWQFRTHPILYVLCGIPGVRFLTIERDAELHQNAAEGVADGYTALRDRADYEAYSNRRKSNA